MEEVKIQGGKVLDACNEVQIQVGDLVIILILTNFEKKLPSEQGGRSWQPFGEGKNGHQSFRQPRICYFRDKCIVFARNCKFANLIQYSKQYVPCNDALLAQETLLLSQVFQKVCKSRQTLNSRQNSVC